MNGFISSLRKERRSLAKQLGEEACESAADYRDEHDGCNPSYELASDFGEVRPPSCPQKVTGRVCDAELVFWDCPAGIGKAGVRASDRYPCPDDCPFFVFDEADVVEPVEVVEAEVLARKAVA